jgi:glycosyltransferase involved in cell wall biosynthesis
MADKPEDSALRRFLLETVRAEDYLAIHADVAAAGLDAHDHLLNFGLTEQRPLPGLEVRRGAAAAQSAGPGWQVFTWRGEHVAFRREVPVPSAVLAQIMAQARHDPAILAAGAKALPNLRRFDALDLADRDGVATDNLMASVPARPGAVIVVPHLVVGGADKYSADLADALASGGTGPVLVIVTDQTAAAARGWEKLAIFTPFRNAHVMFWRDACGGPGHASPMMLARFLNALRPSLIVVVNSRLGLDAVAAFGRGLSQCARIACAFFSMGVDGLGAPYGTRFPRRTLPFALALTDNEPMADQLRRLYGEIPGPGIALLPPRIQPATEAVFAARLAARRARTAGREPGQGGGRRWAWVSRIEPFKGTELLAALARARPADQFDVFGPLEGDAGALGLVHPNIALCGNLPDVTEADFTAHDGFLFTSLCEGMPNVVLEMSQHAIPMVLAEVGGLRHTLGDDAAFFVRHGPSLADSLDGFGRALDRLSALDTEAVARMTAAAKAQVPARHGPEAHARAVTTLFGLPGAPSP